MAEAAARSPNTAVSSGSAVKAPRAPADDRRVTAAVASHASAMPMKIGHETAAKVPRPVATPLPPLKPSHTG